MYSELSRDMGWDWYIIGDRTLGQILTDYPIATKGNIKAFLCSGGSMIKVGFLKCRVSSYERVNFKMLNCRTVSELDNVKHILLNMGFKIDWYNYQLILQMFTEHYKVYAPYIPDKQEDDYNMKGLKQFSYL